MSDEFLGERRRVLENSFFAQRDRELMDKLRKQVKKEALSDACGIKNPAALEALVNANVSPETITALSLIPLIAVAWADGKMDPHERDAICSATESAGIQADSVCRQLLNCWLAEAPQPDLVNAWKEYIQALASTSNIHAIEALRTDVLGHARDVAKAAGGLLGVGSISKREQAVLDDLASAFSA
ncbi:MAG: TerB family tellurite resistance protein [Planctomycetaceae bacterium]|nr:TerB family tellurite resistance protein [Planctomycetales bacterium]MCB9875517.1 TerB family tellurite resistance protein [Planctomycetaceae bacterium]MCB9940001.1 TerB family tellurite resistance protein [Planctomycetaceae bacterium]